MKIGVDIRCFVGGRMTGVESYARNILERMIQDTPEHNFILFYNAFSQKTFDISWATQYKNVRLCRKRFPNKILNFCLWYFKRPYLDRLIGGVDVFFAPNLGFISVSPKCRLMLTAHDLSYEIFPQMFSFKRRLWHLFVGPRRLLKRANAIIAISQSTREDLISYYKIKESKIHVIYSGVSDVFQPMNRNSLALLDVQKRYALPYRFFLFVGTFEPRKNIKTLVEGYNAFRERNQDIKHPPALVIAGASGWKEKKAHRVIDQSPYKNEIIQIGFVSEEDKICLYNLALAFVYPSLYEGFGFPVVEAMRCGVPTIVAHTSSLVEVGGENVLYIDPFRPEDLAYALEEMAKDIRLQEMYRKKSLFGGGQFTWRKCSKETKEILTKL
jgi:glycosyltransferase involved in cell wall biosynthesis